MKTILGLFGALLMATASPAVPAPTKSPLDLKTTLLSKPGRSVPRGLMLGPGCLPPIDEACMRVGSGISYVVEDDVIVIIELTKLGGRFRQPLPYGLSEASAMAQVQAAMARQGVQLGRFKDQPRVLEGGLPRVCEDCWADFEFEANGRLKAVSYHQASGST